MTMNNIQVLNYNEQSIRQTVNEDGEALFCAYDVAQALGYRDAHNILRCLDGDDCPQIVRAVKDDSGREVEVKFINEHQLYAILLMLKTERTKPFRKWVTQEVLPSIRKTGSYNLRQVPVMIPYRHTEITPEVASNLLKSKDEEIKSLRPFKHEIERREDVASSYRGTHKKTKLYMINIQTGKPTTLWNLPYDVMSYLKGLTKVQRGMLFDKWKSQHNFNEFIRFRMKKENFVVK